MALGVPLGLSSPALDRGELLKRRLRGSDLQGPQGDDHGQGDIEGTLHADVIVGSDGKDTVKGGSGDDTIAGGPGLEHLYGNAGKDQIAGDAGRDALDGGDGDDLCEHAWEPKDRLLSCEDIF